jgi:hypothetical protein
MGLPGVFNAAMFICAAFGKKLFLLFKKLNNDKRTSIAVHTAPLPPF